MTLIKLCRSQFSPSYLPSTIFRSEASVFKTVIQDSYGNISLVVALGARSSETAWHSAYLLAVYSLGLRIPFWAIGAAFDSAAPLPKRIRRYSTAIHIVNRVLLMAVGILILTNKLIWSQP